MCYCVVSGGNMGYCEASGGNLLWVVLREVVICYRFLCGEV